MNIIAIDIGTTNCKAIIIDESAKVLKSFQSPTKPINPKLGWNEQNADEVFKAVLKLLKKAINFCEGKNMACVCFSAAMHSLLAVDKNGKPLMNMLTWADLRSAEYAKDLKQKPVAKTIYQATGVPIHAMSPLCKLIWMQHKSKKIFNKAYKFISIKEYIFYKLFGKYIVDYSIAAATGLFDEKNVCWFDESLKIAGITTDKLSELVPIYHAEKTLLPSIKIKLKLNDDIPFVLGASDGALANIGCGLFNAEEAAVTMGTSGAVRVTASKYSVDEQERLFCYNIDKDFFIIGGAVNNGGVALQWLIEKVLRKNFNNEKVFDKIFDEAMQIKAGSEGLIFLPYLNGERSPIWDENARATFIGLTSFHTQAHITKAVVEGICYALYDVLKAVEDNCTSIKKIYLSGGITRSKQWVQLFSNITGNKIYVNEAADASAMGAAFVGMKAVGLLNDFHEVKSFLKKVRTIQPNAKQHSVYKKYFKIYQSLYAEMKDSFDMINKIDSEN